MPKAQPKLSEEHQLQLQDLHHEIDIIKNNHLVHLSEDITDLSAALKETKQEVKERFDKIDERIWWVVGLTVTTLITIVISQVFGA